MPRVSVIVPVYNSREYLGPCVESVLNQSYADFELILIDDGSTDGCAEMCDRFASYDHRVRCVHMKNSGVSAARNLGLSLATGEYVTFVDSDDYVSEGFLASAVGLMESDEELDFVQYSMDRFNSSGIFYREESDDVICDLPEFASVVKFWGSACAGFLKTMIIKEYDLVFNSDLKLGEDQSFLYGYLEHCRKCSKRSEIYYHYRSNQESATHNPSVHDLVRSIDYFSKTEFPYFFRNKIEETLFSLYFQLVISKDIAVSQVSSIGERLDFKSIDKPKRKLEYFYLLISKISCFIAVALTRFINNAVQKR